MNHSACREPPLPLPIYPHLSTAGYGGIFPYNIPSGVDNIKENIFDDGQYVTDNKHPEIPEQTKLP